MLRKKIPYLLLLLISIGFLGRFTFLQQIPIDSRPLYQISPWNHLPQAEKYAYPEDSAAFYHNIDPVVGILPLKMWLASELQHGELPLWIPGIFSGAPFAANAQAAPWDLPSVLFRLLSPEKAFGWTLVFQLFIAGAGMFFYCRVLQLSRTGSLTAALAFMFNSYILHWLGVLGISSGMIWMPLLPAGIELALRRNDYRFLAISALAFGFQFLSGNAQFWIYNCALLLGYGLYRALQHPSLRTGLWTSIAFAAGIAVGAAAITSVVSTIPHAGRKLDSGTKMYAGKNHLSPRKLVTLLVPDFYGNNQENVFGKLLLKPPDPLARGFWGRLIWGEKGSVLNRCWGYIGIVPFLLSLAGMFRCSGPFRFHRLVACGILLFQVLLSLDWIHNLLQWILPGLDSLDQTRSIILYIASASVLAGSGMDRLPEFRQILPTLKKMFGLLIGLLSLVVVTLYVLPKVVDVPDRVSTRWAPSLESTYTQNFFLEAGPAVSRGFTESARILYFPLLVFLALFLILHYFTQNRIGSSVFNVLLVSISLIDVCYHGWYDPPLAFTNPKDLYPDNSEVLQFLQAETGPFRVYDCHLKRLGPALPLDHYQQLDRYRKGNIRFFDIQTVQFSTRPNTLLPYGIDSAGGYMSLYPERYKLLWEGRGNDTLKALRPGETAEHWNQPWVGMQNIHYVLAPDSAPAGNWQPVLEAEGIKLLPVSSYCPRLYVVPHARIISDPQKLLAELKSPAFRPREEVLLEESPEIPLKESGNVSYQLEKLSYRANNISFDIRLDADGYLFMADCYFPGWRAWVDGSEQRILRANFAFRCLPLKKGAHTISMEYVPDYYTISKYSTLLSTLLLLLLLGFGSKVVAANHASKCL